MIFFNNPPIEDPGFLEDVSQVDVGVQEVRVERDGLLEVVDGQPDLALRVEHAAQVAPGDGKVGPGLDGLQVASLQGGRGREREKTGVSGLVGRRGRGWG